ncbi:hypothetical protein ACQKLP_21910 [Chitinophaga sp. NPDC101104]|uniref:hypothetical protein n=1 Tax=Chitinophaga sp. NPDC101104 TaxID=3390561 RepID=UPI003CFCEF4B
MKRLIPFLILLAGCSASRKATETEQEISALNNLMAGLILEAPVASPFTVPGGMIALQAPCADFDSGTVKSSAGKLRVVCPDHHVNADSLVRNNPIFKLAIAARSLADAKEKLQDKKIALLEADNAQLKAESSDKGRKLRNVTIVGFALAVAVIGWMIYKFKTVGFGLFKRMK